MSVALQLLLIALSVGGLLAAMAGAHVLAQRFGWSAELQRKCVHVTTGLYALSLPLTFGEVWPVLLLSVLSIAVMAAMRLPAMARSRIGSTIHGIERKSYGEILLAVAVGFTFFRSIDNPVLYVLPILVLTFSDAAAALAGVHYGKRLFTVEDGVKSFEGVTIFFLVTFIIAMVTLLLMTDIERPNVILLSLVVAAFGALLEADSWRGLDNLFVPVGLHLFLQNNLDTPAGDLLLGSAVFVAILLGLALLAPRLDLTPHAARGYGILAFLIMSVTATHNALLPLAALVAFMGARRIAPCRSPHADLDFLAMAAGVGALWLFLGEWSGHNAINLYNLTFAGAAAAFSMLALKDRPLLAIGLALAFGAAVFALVPYNSAAARWMPAFAAAIAASLALCILATVIAPDRLARWRTPRVFALALVVPVLLFIVRSATP